MKNHLPYSLFPDEETYSARREFLQTFGLGFGALAFSSMLAQDSQGASSTHRSVRDMSARLSHFAPKAKSVIFLFQNGGASQMDLFDPKPELTRRNGQKTSEIRGGNANGPSSEPLMGSAFQFRPYGQAGIEFSELVPHLASVVDDLCVVRSMYSNDPNHPGATYMMCTGNNRPGRPSLGAWCAYALGSESQNLPGYVCLRDPGVFHSGGAMQITNGWLPAQFRGTELRTEGEPVLNLHSAAPRLDGVQQNNLAFLEKLNRLQQQRYPTESVLDARIQNYELAARMQLHASPELDLSNETQATEKLYGMDREETATYGRRLLLARRLVERGVRYVMVLSPGPHNVWDHHAKLNIALPAICRRTDQPSAGLITDLKQRGLLDETLVVWTGEFGRLPTSQGGSGRDHSPHGFTLLMAGGGLKPGFVYGATDEIGYKAVENPVSVPDLFATLLHQLGLDHERMTFDVHGIEENVTDTKVNHARVVSELLV
jgi:hypothetical protein